MAQSGLERCVRDAKVGGSNPLTPTICSVYGILDTTFGPAKIPFFIFPAKGSLKNPYKDAMVDVF